MDYPGNATLTREMQERILSTFQQTLSAAAAGNRQEATLGCDFILRLDSLFGPARQLLDRLEGGEGPVSIDDLAEAVGTTAAAVAEGGAAADGPAEDQAARPPAAAASPPPEIDDLSDLDLEMGLSDQAPAPQPPPPAATEVEPPAPTPATTEIEPPEPAPPAAEVEPHAPEAPSVPELDELDDLDLTPGAEPGQEAPAAEALEPPPAPDSVEIPLDAEPSAQLDSESQQRIHDLLAEGQEAFGGGEYQLAIDAWSRIFLIDIDHAEANQRIEEARKLKAEADRKVEEKFHEGLAHLEGGEPDAAAASFRVVLEMQPSHLAARDYLEKLDAGEVPVPAELSRPAEAEADLGELEGPDAEAGEEPVEAPAPRPDRGSKAVGESMVTVKKSPFKSKGFLAIAAVGLIAVLGGAWYLFDNWSSLFPNSGQEAPAPAPSDPLVRAKGLHDQGKTPMAIAQLRRLPPDNPQYEEAQALIAQWELEQAPPELGPEGPSPQELARRESLVAEAGAAAERREFMRVSELLSEAAAIAPLRGAEAQLLARADEELQELQNFINLFREGEWDLALRDLWLLRESDPGNRDVARLLIDSYYNLGLRALQRKDVKVAAEHFQQALELSPGDPELLRLADFAATYRTRGTDLLYRIFVKYHPFR